MNLPSVDALISSSDWAGEGIHRSGHLVGNVCIKQALSYGALANQYEVEGWEAVKDTDDARLFCPVLAHAEDYSWVAMPRCEPVAWDDPSEGPADVELVPYGGSYYAHPDFVAWLDSEDGRRAGALTSDLHMFNVMRHPDGHLVVTDYGMGLNEWALDDPSASADPDCYSNGQERRYHTECGCCVTCGCGCGDEEDEGPDFW